MLKPKQIEWLDDHLCLTATEKRFKTWREQADRAWADTLAAREKMARKSTEQKAA